ncbi:hypothetical protein DH2020_042743 [Rehmannia glutinosa]|uniref:Uncharacterized protein n=1 Tax=Rehmannia glutinosa TaxID=99300 RepID=A0ABR0UN96_REHGL
MVLKVHLKAYLIEETDCVILLIQDSSGHAEEDRLPKRDEFMDGYDSIVQEKLDAVMPWIGMYIASASAVCTLAMAADLLYGFKRKKLWFPCKYFSLSATSLTLLAVAMKIPMDLNTNMLHSADLLAKLGSLVFMSTAMANFMSSLGSMNDKELLANIVALGILVITIVANVLIQHIQLRQIPKYVGVVLLPTISVMLLLVTFVSLAITIPTTKRSLESKYQEKHRVALTEEEVILIVLISKLVVFICALLMSPFFLCFGRINKFLMWLLSKVMTSDNNGNDQLGDDTDINLTSYLLLLEGEAELPRRILKDIVRRADNTIQAGLKKQPQCLINLLTKFVGFNGVGEFDRNQIPSLHSYEPPNCWTLPVVTLTTIAVALPNIAKDKKDQLVSSVGEGLSLAKIVEKTFNTNAQLWNIKKAADVSWVRVALCRNWLDMDLRKTSLKVKTSKEVLQKLSNKAGRTIMEFKREVKDAYMENPLYWPVKVVAANSMYRVSRTILLSCEAENEVTDDGLFEGISVMIADILAACLTNLAHVITTMCHRNAIEKREESVQEAFLLLGKTEQILELLQQREWPSLDHDKATYIDEWRAFFCPGVDDDPAVQLQVII